MQQQATPPFNPAAVPIALTLNYHQINLVLEGLGLMPYEKVASLYAQVQTTGTQTLKEAQDQYLQMALLQPSLVEAAKQLAGANTEPAPEVVLPQNPPPADNLPSDKDWEQTTGQAQEA